MHGVGLQALSNMPIRRGRPLHMIEPQGYFLGRTHRQCGQLSNLARHALFATMLDLVPAKEKAYDKD